MGEKNSRRPYLAGAAVGVIAVLSVYVSTNVLSTSKYLGASTTFVRAAGVVEKTIVPEHVASNEYYREKGVEVNWQFMLVVGILGGALLTSVVEREFRVENVPPIWKERFGNGKAFRALGAFLGGVVAMFGARLAGGCPSGHGLSGLMQLSISGFLAMAGFFGGGVLVAYFTYRKEARDDR